MELNKKIRLFKLFKSTFSIVFIILLSLIIYIFINLYFYEKKRKIPTENILLENGIYRDELNEKIYYVKYNYRDKRSYKYLINKNTAQNIFENLSWGVNGYFTEISLKSVPGVVFED